MAFVLRLGGDGQFTIDGEPVEEAASGYRRSGAFQLENGWLTSAAINEGRPARLAMVQSQLRLIIDDTLTISFLRD